MILHLFGWDDGNSHKGTRLINYLYGLWNPEVQCLIHKTSPIILILSQINPIPHIEEGLRLHNGLFPVGLRVNISKALLPSSILAT